MQTEKPADDSFCRMLECFRVADECALQALLSPDDAADFDRIAARFRAAGNAALAELTAAKASTPSPSVRPVE